MPTSYRFYCEGCVTLFTDGRGYETACQRCVSEFKQVKKVQTKIIQARPELRRLSPAKLMAKLHLLLKEKEQCR